MEAQREEKRVLRYGRHRVRFVIETARGLGRVDASVCGPLATRQRLEPRFRRSRGYWTRRALAAAVLAQVALAFGCGTASDVACDPASVVACQCCDGAMCTPGERQCSSSGSLGDCVCGGSQDAGTQDQGQLPSGPTQDVDILVVVDPHYAPLMTPLRAAVEQLAKDLFAGQTGSGCGVNPQCRTFTPMRSVRIGAISSDIGSVDGRFCTLEGERALLRSEPAPEDTSCPNTFGRWLDLESESPLIQSDEDRLEEWSRCILYEAAPGCDLVQPLEASLQALSPSTSSLGFLRGSGRGDVENAGFLRDDSLLVILMVTPNEDCSTFEPTFWELDSPQYADTPPGDRCHERQEGLWPISRYVDGLTALRHPSRLVLFPMTPMASFPPSRDTVLFRILSNPSSADEHVCLDEIFGRYSLRLLDVAAALGEVSERPELLGDLCTNAEDFRINMDLLSFEIVERTGPL